MSVENALGAYPCAEGVVISGFYENRATSLVAGGEAPVRAGAGGVLIGRAAWAEPDGRVLNERVSAQGMLGLVGTRSPGLPFFTDIYWDYTVLAWRIREGQPVPLFERAPGMWVRLPGGGNWRDRIYANPVDGSLSAGYADGFEPMPWVVGKPTGPGGLTLLTTWMSPNE